MRIFSSIPDPWAKIVAVVVTIGLGVLFYFITDPGFGIGVACGGVFCMAIHWAARIDERPFWQHVFGRSVVYTENTLSQAAEPGAAADRSR